MKLLLNPKDDMLLGSLVIAFLNPLAALLYARYCDVSPVLRASLAAVLLGVVEVGLEQTGYMTYWNWNPLFTMIAFFLYFMIVRQVVQRITAIPLWIHLHGMVLWSGLLLDILLQGILWRWSFNMVLFGDLVRDNRLLSMLVHSLLIFPFVTFISLRQVRSRLFWIGGATALLVTLEGMGRVTGFLVYDHWSLGWSALKYVGMLGMTSAYAHWLRAQTLSGDLHRS